VLTPHRDAHLNLVDSSRQLFEMDPGAEIEVGDGWVLGAGRSSHPVISNAAFRTDDGHDPAELLKRAREFFAERSRGFAVWARSDDDDRDLIAAAEREGLKEVYAFPAMVLKGRPPEQPLPGGAELARVASAADAEDYWRVAANAYASNGFPPEIFAFYENHDGFLAHNLAGFLARLDGEPAAIAMTIVSHGVAGIYWVGSTDATRGRGLGSAVTAAAIGAGLDLGGGIVSLQASPMGEPIYRRMGFETIYDYRLLACRAPEEER
jgi:GNAT superfamily N-acetyltransferase